MVDISHEHIALAESKRLGITTFAMVDTNSDPTKVDFPVPSNDDATKSIAIITNYLTAAIMEGLQERAQLKEVDEDNGEEVTDNRSRSLELGGEEEGGNKRGGGGAGSGRAKSARPAGGPGARGGSGRPGGGAGGGSRPGGGGGGPRRN
jgi:small subunit ribosomal protein S2